MVGGGLGFGMLGSFYLEFLVEAAQCHKHLCHTNTSKTGAKSISQHSIPSLCSGLSSDSLHWFFLLPLATTCLLSQSLAIPVRLLRSEECGLQCHWPLVHRPFRMVEDRLQSTAVPWFFMYFIEITVQIRKKLEGCWVPFRRS